MKLIDFLLKKTNALELCVIREGGWTVATCWIDYEDLFSIVPDDINELILSYSNINNNGIKTKRIILNKLYNYLLSDIEKYKSYNSSIFSSIKLVINKMGVVGDIDKKYQNLSNYKLRKYYDYCFNMMTYLLRTEAINKYKEELKSE